MLHHCYLSLLFSVIVMQVASGQHASWFVSGMVTSQEDGAHLEGVTVKVRGSTSPASSSGSQQDGAYYVEVTDRDSVLVFSLEDYETKEVRLSVAKEYNVQLCRKKSVTSVGIPLPMRRRMFRRL
jgi:hypothetical protein